MKTALYIYLILSLCYSLYVLASLWLADREGRDFKFGYNFKDDDGRFCIGVQVWFMLFISLPIVNLVWLYLSVANFFRWRNK